MLWEEKLKGKTVDDVHYDGVGITLVMTDGTRLSVDPEPWTHGALKVEVNHKEVGPNERCLDR